MIRAKGQILNEISTVNKESIDYWLPDAPACLKECVRFSDHRNQHDTDGSSRLRSIVAAN